MTYTSTSIPSSPVFLPVFHPYSLILMECITDTEAHAQVLTQISPTIVNQAMTAVTILELLDQDGAQLWVNLRL